MKTIFFALLFFACQAHAQRVTPATLRALLSTDKKAEVNACLQNIGFSPVKESGIYYVSTKKTDTIQLSPIMGVVIYRTASLSVFKGWEKEILKLKFGLTEKEQDEFGQYLTYEKDKSAFTIQILPSEFKLLYFPKNKL